MGELPWICSLSSRSVAENARSPGDLASRATGSVHWMSLCPQSSVSSQPPTHITGSAAQVLSQAEVLLSFMGRDFSLIQPKSPGHSSPMDYFLFMGLYWTRCAEQVLENLSQPLLAPHAAPVGPGSHLWAASCSQRGAAGP